MYRAGLMCALRTGKLVPFEPSMSDLKLIISKIRAFRDERDWAQFHNPKDMAIALSIETNELLEHFLWKNPQEVADRIATKREEIEDELADIGIYLTELADNLGVDLLAAMERKLEKNAKKYPVAKAKGSNSKYTEL
jgi:dCTP diphosphatase